MAHKLLDITPTPQVLVALTRTPLTPLDAVSELVDNAIDSFRSAQTSGRPSPVRQVRIDIPGQSEVARGEGLVRVRDTGAGLTEDQIADAMRAGFTDKNHFDTLGLFGMGFNIATGKLGRVTQVVSARAEDDHAVRVTLDLPKLMADRTFEVRAERIDKPNGLDRGTVVEVRGWWPDGDANSGFIRDLAKTTKAKLRSTLGHRYATLLRGAHGDPVHLLVNNQPCEPFEHCVWDASRFVERQGYGRIPARIDFDEVVSRSRRCLADGAEFGAADSCPRCGSPESREVEHRVRGWVGVQRFDDANAFGIDLIRNGRAIRVAEKAAFFDYVDELGVQEREYPVDQQYGRIVGEVHLDQVPVDFQKQGFQQATPEWQAAMAFLRGGSLLPSRWPDGTTNDSPVSRLRRGYGKVRNFGRADMYMGQYSAAKGKAERISRDIEREYLQKFKAHEPGYYDDAKWWELVETAAEPPIAALPECPNCGFQNPGEAELCGGCSGVLLGKACLSADCRQQIPRSTVTCEHCGASQIPRVQIPWTCTYCETENTAEAEQCGTCGSLKGAPHPAGTDVLAAASEETPELGATRVTVTLADGKVSDPLDVIVRSVPRPITPAYGQEAVPLVTATRAGHLTVFVDLTHPVFTAIGVRPEYLIAAEAAQYLHQVHHSLRGRPGHTIATLTAELLRQGWGETVTENADTVRQEIKELFTTATFRIENSPHAADFYQELDEGQLRSMAETMIQSGVDLGEMANLKASGAYLRYCDRDVLAAFFAAHPEDWFDGRVWQSKWPSTHELGQVVAEKMQQELRTKFLRCIEDCASYLRYEQPERLIVVRARAAADFLTDNLS